MLENYKDRAAKSPAFKETSIVRELRKNNKHDERCDAWDKSSKCLETMTMCPGELGKEVDFHLQSKGTVLGGPSPTGRF